MCHLELVGNEQDLREKSDLESVRLQHEIPSYGDYWEKILKQQVDYFAEEKEKLKQKMVQEMQEARYRNGGIASETELAHIMSDVE